MTILIMTILIMTILVVTILTMKILITLNIGDIATAYEQKESKRKRDFGCQTLQLILQNCN